MSNRFRREAAVLAAYLAQFDDTGISTADNDRLGCDYLQARAWSTAVEPSSDDTAALARMRRYYGFPPTT